MNSRDGIWIWNLAKLLRTWDVGGLNMRLTPLSSFAGSYSLKLVKATTARTTTCSYFGEEHFCFCFGLLTWCFFCLPASPCAQLVPLDHVQRATKQDEQTNNSNTRVFFSLTFSSHCSVCAAFIWGLVLSSRLCALKFQLLSEHVFVMYNNHLPTHQVCTGWGASQIQKQRVETGEHTA